MKKMTDYLNVDGAILFKIAMWNRFRNITDNSYTEICGSWIEGVFQWGVHNIESVCETSNDKYTGWTIFFPNATRRVYIPNWVMEYQPKDFKHAKSLFEKYLKEDHVFNTDPINSISFYE